MIWPVVDASHLRAFAARLILVNPMWCPWHLAWRRVSTVDYLSGYDRVDDGVTDSAPCFLLQHLAWMT